MICVCGGGSLLAGCEGELSVKVEFGNGTTLGCSPGNQHDTRDTPGPHNTVRHGGPGSRSDSGFWDGAGVSATTTMLRVDCPSWQVTDSSMIFLGLENAKRVSGCRSLEPWSQTHGRGILSVDWPFVVALSTQLHGSLPSNRILCAVPRGRWPLWPGSRSPTQPPVSRCPCHFGTKPNKMQAGFHQHQLATDWLPRCSSCSLA